MANGSTIKIASALITCLLLGISGWIMMDSYGDYGAEDRPLYFPVPTRAVSGEEWPMYMGDSTHQGRSLSDVPEDNSTLWSKTIPSLFRTNSPLIYDGIVYIGSGDGKLRGLDPDTGATIWEVDIGSHHIAGTPVIDGDSIYFGSGNGDFYGYSLGTRAKLWTETKLQSLSVLSAPVIGDGMAYISTSSQDHRGSRFYAIYTNNGTIGWSFAMNDIENYWGFQSSPAYHNGNVFVGDGWGNFSCLDGDGFLDGTNDGFIGESDKSNHSGDILWFKKLGAPVVGDPMVAGGRVFIGDIYGYLYALDEATGTEIWKVKAGSGSDSFPGIQSSPSYDGTALYLSAQRSKPIGGLGGSVLALDPDDGTVLWRFNTSQEITGSSPILGEGVAIFGAQNSHIYCISTSTENLADEDRILWKRNVGSPIWSTAALALGRVFVAFENPSHDGQVWAIGVPDPELTYMTVSDNSPIEGETVTISVNLSNDATVGAVTNITFYKTTESFYPKERIGAVEGVSILPGEEKTVEMKWTAETGFPLIAAYIDHVYPKDKTIENNIASALLPISELMTAHWTSAGGGPGKTGFGDMGLMSNKTYWTKSLGAFWTGAPEDIWYNGSHGSGGISGVASKVFLTGPDGSLIALNTSLSEEAPPSIDWQYSDETVVFSGRPALYFENTESLAIPNKVFVTGSDDHLWAFDWRGFNDGSNEGPYIGESYTTKGSGDVSWRVPLSDQLLQPIFISGGNVIVTTLDGRMKAYDDDTGEEQWEKASPTSPFAIASGLRTIYYIRADGAIHVIGANDGAVEGLMDMSAVVSGERITHISYFDDMLLLVHGPKITAIDATPDDNGDGSIDEDDDDEGIEDSIAGIDLLWSRSLSGPVSSPPAISETGRVIGAVSGLTIYFLGQENGTEMKNLSLTGEPSSRITSGGGSFYIITGSSPWTMESYSPDEMLGYRRIWTYDLHSRPTGEPAMIGCHMYISTQDGWIISLGDSNSPPTAVISSPVEGEMAFSGGEIVLNGSLSSDPEGDSLIYSWYFEGETVPIYEGNGPVLRKRVAGVGDRTLVLRVYDEMKAYGEARVNITLLKRIQSLENPDSIHGVYANVSYGISDQSAILLFMSSPADDLPGGIGDDPRAVYICKIEYVVLPEGKRYLFEWANVSISFDGKEFPVKMHIDSLALYKLSDDIWKRAPNGGVDPEEKTVWGNLSALEEGYYAIGVLDNELPLVRHDDSKDVVRPGSGRGYQFTIQYRDPDGDAPDHIKLFIEKTGLEYDLEPKGVSNHTRFSDYIASDVSLVKGPNLYHIEVDDGHFTIISQKYNKNVENSPPVVEFKFSPQSPVKEGQEIVFDATATYDLDGDELNYTWDFGEGIGPQRDQRGNKVSHVFMREGAYEVILIVSDGSTEVSKTRSIVVEGGAEEDSSSIGALELIIFGGLILILLIALVLFILFSRKGAEEEKHITRDLIEEGWSCPECNEGVDEGRKTCPGCGYEYDPLDFEETVGSRLMGDEIKDVEKVLEELED